ncbi:transglycosylase SLT domain-containing protein [Nocardia sp. CDC160]|uniref:transglycosylase SLT domain-containing protein n=1 Tax=Nocardia sp. CDC160 TaxID=3112166 RepID=UPI002DB73AE0|nr:transglycosylase SLT domain-containing protein [Nocardia sp. CDC160]MEC3920684.1 transglycosylase SLT domain-containing protein [Nocardia sp. CDC160]
MPTGPIAWDSQIRARYSAETSGRTDQANAISDLNVDLNRILNTSADNSIQGRAAMTAIIADVDSALTALGPVEDSPQGQYLLASVLEQALRRAVSVLTNGRVVTVLSAQQVSELAARYLQQTHTLSPSNRTVYPLGEGVSGGPPSTQPSGRQRQWINDALQILREHGYDTSRINPADVAAIIQHESSGNPNAINLQDSNAAAGHPSKGLMQTIDPTFRAYALPGHQNIWNPVDNIIAGIRYAIARYGSVANVPGVVHLHAGGSYVGY